MPRIQMRMSSDTKALLSFLKEKERTENEIFPSYSDILAKIVDKVSDMDRNNEVVWSEVMASDIPDDFSGYRNIAVDISYGSIFVLSPEILGVIDRYKRIFAGLIGMQRDAHRGYVTQIFIKAYLLEMVNKLPRKKGV